MQGSPDVSAAVVGCIFLLITGSLIAGLVVSARRMKRPDANRKCYVAFILFTCGWLLYAAIASLSLYAQQRLLGAVVGLAVFGILGMSGIVTAILGLSELRGEPGKTGRVPALFTLVLASVMIVALGSVVAAGAVPGLLGRSNTVSALGFSLSPPGTWTRIDPARGGPGAVVGYTMPRPDAFLRVLVSKADATMDLKAIAEGIRAQNRKGSPDLVTVDEREESFRGVGGYSLVIEMTGKVGPMVYWYWIHATESLWYVLIVSGPLEEKEAILSVGRKAFETFRLTAK